jgi:outer membrane receptor protein involved in Fe transport
VTTAELFARRNLLEGTLRLTGNVFHSAYRNMQLPFDLNPSPTEWAYVVRNAPRAKTWGAEFGAEWLPIARLRLGGEIGLLKTEVKQYPGSGIEGHELARAPKFSAAFRADYRTAAGIGFGADARYTTSYYSDITNVERGRVKPGWIVNARADYRFAQARVFAYVKNLFDNQRPLLVEAAPAGSADDDVAQLPRPRTAGVGLELWY